MTPRNATISGLLILAGVGLGFVLFFGWDILRHFPSTDLSEPFRQRANHFDQPAANFIVFSAFVLKIAFDVPLFFLGIFLVIRAALMARKYLTRPTSH
jgi:hypothetical protein